MNAIAKQELCAATAPQPTLSLFTSPETRSRIVCESPVMQDVIVRVHRYSSSNASVLLTGETGTGKELVAQLLHERSARSDQRYARINCAALSESLIESELFGHERGAFTGAEQPRVGRFEWAGGGTLLLDEVGELSLASQAKLLRVLEEREFQRVGSNETRSADVRVIASTNRDLAREVEAGRFRRDLFYRLKILAVRLPALRERREDIPILAGHFMHEYEAEGSVASRAFANSTLEQLVSHSWPGNVRELRNVVHHACIVAQHEVIQPQDLPQLEQASEDISQHYAGMTLEQVERLAILDALRTSNGNKTHAATQLGVTTRTLRNKLAAYRQQGHYGV